MPRTFTSKSSAYILSSAEIPVCVPELSLTEFGALGNPTTMTLSSQAFVV